MGVSEGSGAKREHDRQHGETSVLSLAPGRLKRPAARQTEQRMLCKFGLH